MKLFSTSDMNNGKSIHFQLPRMLLENVEKNSSEFMDRCDGNLHFRIIAGVVETVLDIISFRLLFNFHYYLLCCHYNIIWLLFHCYLILYATTVVTKN